jgi:hypothetical protein
MFQEGVGIAFGLAIYLGILTYCISAMRDHGKLARHCRTSCAPYKSELIGDRCYCDQRMTSPSGNR